ncbi:MAG TPA: ABC transporter substrate-binding protein, partial [Candidatus Binatia bacterium]|nr:ABC transporter substrate-binding protein [Candidatus Binatia bacterium]
AARHYGLDPDRDIKIIVTGPSPLRLAALKAGSIDATAIDVAFAVKGEEEGLTRLLYLGDIIELPLSGVGVTDEKIAKDREQVKKVIRATLKGTRFMKQNRGETLRMMTEYLGITSGQAAKTYDSSIRSFTDDGMVSDKGLALDLQLVKERLKLTKDIPLSQVVDWSLLREVK